MSERGCGVSIPDLSRARWRTSSHSSGNGECVEVAEAQWRTSSHSSGNGACIQVADARPMVAVRDSKDPHGPSLTFAPQAWQAFIRRAKCSPDPA
jgi:hypothetical protein